MNRPDDDRPSIVLFVLGNVLWIGAILVFWLVAAVIVLGFLGWTDR